MKNFTYKSFLKYLFCALLFYVANHITLGVPLSIALLPAFMSAGFSLVPVGLLFCAINFLNFSFTQSIALSATALFFILIFSVYKIKNAKVKGELFIYLLLSLIPYYLQIFSGSIYTKLVYSAIIYIFAIISTLALKIIFIGAFKRKNRAHEQVAFYLFIIINSLGGCAILGVEIYNLIALTVMLFFCKFYKSPSAFIPAFILPVAISLYTQSLSPLALFEIYCATILIFINLSPLLSALALILAQVAVYYLSGELFAFELQDYLLSFTPSLLYLFIPQKLIEKLKSYILRFEEPEITKQIINNERSLICLKLNDLSNLFYDMEQALNCFDQFFITKESVCEKMADELLLNVCSPCPFYADCVRKNHPKRKDLLKLINIGISKETVSIIDLSRDFSSYCYSVNNMVCEINKLISAYLQKNSEHTQIKEQKRLISSQAGAVGEVLRNLAFDLSYAIDFSLPKEKKIFNNLAENGILPRQIVCFGKEFHILFSKEKVNFTKVCLILSEIIGEQIRLNRKCEVLNGILAVFTKAPIFDASFGVAQIAKEGGAVCGDSHSLTRINEGCFIVSLCDGMGSGDKAYKNSHTAITLFETLYKSGLSKQGSLDLANKMLSACSNESFSSLDSAIIDLFSGHCDIIKIGATYGFLISANNVRVLENKSLPLGILEEVVPDMFSIELTEGDMLVIISDGISDAFFSSTDTVEFLEREVTRNPQTLADKLLNYALTQSNGIASDDMTAIVVKIYKRQVS